MPVVVIQISLLVISWYNPLGDTTWRLLQLAVERPCLVSSAIGWAIFFFLLHKWVEKTLFSPWRSSISGIVGSLHFTGVFRSIISEYVDRLKSTMFFCVMSLQTVVKLLVSPCSCVNLRHIISFIMFLRVNWAHIISFTVLLCVNWTSYYKFHHVPVCKLGVIL